ncbi:MAG: cyanophycinase [Firmicutes bacterium]|nr:cyanophycinase [Bacillota bacterium]
MGEKVEGRLLIIGGAEDREGDCEILREVVALAKGRGQGLVVITAASRGGAQLGREYREIFQRLGARRVRILHVNQRERANDPAVAVDLRRAGGIFFSGGDQLRLTSLLGGTRVEREVRRAYEGGALIAGTSAGASAMSDTMIVEGPDDDPPRRCTLKMAPGFRLLKEVVVDQHFAQRGRLGRLLGVVAQNPYTLGLGIDEDTAVEVNPRGRFRVLGSYTATVIDGLGIEVSNVSEANPDAPLALTQVKMHILPAGYGFDLKKRLPLTPAAFKCHRP